MKSTDLQQLPDFDALYAYLRAHYRAERFELRAGPWCPDYPKVVTQSSMEHLELCGYSCVGQYESVTGRAVYFNCALEEIAAMEAIHGLADRTRVEGDAAVAPPRDPAPGRAHQGSAAGVYPAIPTQMDLLA